MVRQDPLIVFPQELLLQILSHTDVPTLTRLEAVSKTWRAFSVLHSHLIWSHQALKMELEKMDSDVLKRSEMKAGKVDLDQLLKSKNSCEPETWEGVVTWKDYCERRYSLSANLARKMPILSSREVDTEAVNVWRLRIDYEARLLICTAHQGGLYVYDLDETGQDSQPQVLWGLPTYEIEPYAHLEYSKGTLAINALVGSRLQIWRRKDLIQVPVSQDQPNGTPGNLNQASERGTFVEVGTLHHDEEIRGFQLLYPTLCVVSRSGKAWIWDVSCTPPVLTRTLAISRGARGHLDQDESMVMFSMKTQGYHLYDKSTGSKLGELDPTQWTLDPNVNIFHIDHPPSFLCSITYLRDYRGAPLSPSPDDQHTCVELKQGAMDPKDRINDQTTAALADDEWGAGMVCGSIMVGIAKSGRVMIVSDWPRVLKDPSAAKDVVALIECNSRGGSHYDLGGWLSLGGRVGNLRAAWEVNDRVYLFPLPEVGKLPLCKLPEETSGSSPRSNRVTTRSQVAGPGSPSTSTLRNTQKLNASASHDDPDVSQNNGRSRKAETPLPIIALPGTCNPELSLPISCMSLQEDHLVMTYASTSYRYPPQSDVGGGRRAPLVPEDGADPAAARGRAEGGPEAGERDRQTRLPHQGDATGQQPQALPRLVLQKTPRFVHFAPWIAKKRRRGVQEAMAAVDAVRDSLQNHDPALPEMDLPVEDLGGLLEEENYEETDSEEVEDEDEDFEDGMTGSDLDMEGDSNDDEIEPPSER